MRALALDLAHHKQLFQRILEQKKSPDDKKCKTQYRGY